MLTSEVKKIYYDKRKDIQARLREFRQVWGRKDDKEIFGELTFCILTPQSKAKTCWNAVTNLIKQNLLWQGTEKQVLAELKGVRFKYKKANYIIKARNLFSNKGEVIVRPRLRGFPDVFKARDWLVRNVKGLGYKEASHFLRNIGMGKDLAILDRHILKNLKRLNVITDIPDSLSRKRYFEIEKKMVKFANRMGIPASNLDLVLWSSETGEVFK